MEPGSTTIPGQARRQGGKAARRQGGKALPAITFGIVGAVGQVKEQAVTLPLKLVRGEGVAANSDDVLMERLIQAAVSEISDDDVVTADRTFPPVKLLENGCKAIVIRRPKNMTLRRTEIAVYKGRGRKPTQGEVVRPFTRTYLRARIKANYFRLPNRMKPKPGKKCIRARK